MPVQTLAGVRLPPQAGGDGSELVAETAHIRPVVELCALPRASPALRQDAAQAGD